jgi:threonine dehydrogenase-like Zn-dependent dehydrogenase
LAPIGAGGVMIGEWGAGCELTLAGDRRVRRGTFRCDAPQGSQVLARVETVGICATDLALFNGSYSAPHRTPICFGHEWAGVVEAVGPDVRHLRPGNRVTGECSLWCGACDRCKQNKNLCRRIEKFGITVDGAARDRVLLQERHLHLAPLDLGSDLLALAEPLAVCHQGLVAGGLGQEEHAPQRVLIIGGGMIGQGCALLARRMFGCDVLLHDLQAARRKRAGDLGIQVLAGLPVVEQGSDYGRLYEGDLFDLVVETTGAPAAFQQALRLVDPGGSIALLGFTGETAIMPKSLVIKAARLCGSIGGSGSFEAVLPWLAAHQGKARQLISHRYPAAKAEQAFEAARDRQNALKVQVSFA